MICSKSARESSIFTESAFSSSELGFFDYRFKDEGYDDGYQSVPVNWAISSARKRGFFELLAEMTGAKTAPK